MSIAPLRVIGFFSLLALVAACGSGEQRQSARPGSAPKKTPAASYEKAPCPDPIYPDAPQLGLGPDVECGYLSVPQRRADPNSRKIKLAVAVRKSTSPDPRPDPVVYLAGGPGNPALIHNFDDWQLDRDLILVDQRGTMADDPFLSCPEVDRFLVDAIAIGAENPAFAEQSAAAVFACRQRLAGQVLDVAAYNTTESAADVADLRVAMGIDQWNVYGLSYGADLALQTLRDHPQGIRSAVLDSVLPPQANLIESGWASAAASFKAIFDGCAADAACAAAFPDVRGEFARMVNELSASPLQVTVDDANGKPTDVVIDGYKLAGGVVAAAAQTPGRPARVPVMIHKLATGDPTDVATALTATTPPNLVGHGLRYGVLCAEAVSRTNADNVLAVGRHTLPDFPDSVLSRPAQAPSILRDCDQWKVPAAPPEVAAPARSAVPVLLASGSFDSATPPSFAEEAAKTLPNSRLLVFPGTGHEVASNTPAAATCFLEVMRNFYDNPADYNTDCVGRLQIPPFATT
ncbi:alpha/beta hydrolase [Mycobacterium sp.]|jgi:pimeloyl-ACP methyl ester carboxylesterase|uniref:alpha/beta hydrolase n=1 Tax=Mycobacterium sp. TaxID=1785 RepID=UPI002D628D71|nr:alpha/beta hydrolase [Mycobacterium sp.]HZA10309.1 alpha/beta hydrolase [Mycobacterium sp.]